MVSAGSPCSAPAEPGAGTPGGYRWALEVALPACPPARLRAAPASALGRAAAALSAALLVACGGPPAAAPEAAGPRAALVESDALTDALAAADLSAAQAAAARLRPLAAAVALPPDASAAVDAALAAAAGAPDLAAARTAAARANRLLLPAAAAAAGPQADLHLFSCPMVGEGPAPWVQDTAALHNPYLTEQMPRCGDALAWPAAAPAADAVAFHTCPMHPAVRQPDPGSCPLCGMALVPVSAAALASGEVIVDAGRRQLMGLRTAALSPVPLVEELRLLGVVAWDERARAALTARVDGVVTRARVGTAGERVEAGAVVLELSGPELSAAQDELLLLAARGAADGGAARQRLLRFGIAAQDIDAVLKAGAPRPSLPLRAPIGGFIIEKDFVVGSPVDEGMVLLTLGRADPVTVELRVPELDVPALQPGAVVELVDRAGGRRWSGALSQIDPFLSDETRSATARASVANPDGALRPGAHLQATVRLDHGRGLVAPSEAVLVLGQERVVFVDRGEGRLAPRVVTVGRRVEGGLHLVSGVEPGEQIVVSGTFLVASESRLRTAASLWDAPPEVPPAAP